MSTATKWTNRIVDHGEERPDQLLANPKNWRIHPKHQQNALSTVLEKVGWVQDVIINRTTGFVVDGHLRVAMAITHGDQVIPVSYVELTEPEEDLVLAGLDPSSTLAVADPEALNAILEQDTEGELAALFAPEDRGFIEPRPDAGAPPPSTALYDDETGELLRDEGEYILVCPDCGHEFIVKVDEEE